MKSGFLEKLLARLDRIDPAEAQQLLSRLIREKGFLEQVFEALHEGVIVLDELGQITFVNDAAQKIFGLPDDCLGQHLADRIPGLNWDSLAKPGKTISRDLEIFYPDHRFLNFYLAPIHANENQTNLGWVMLVRDQTRSRQEAEIHLESERLNALTLLAAGVAHEIGNPLNSLDIHLQLMQRQVRKLAADDRKKLSENLDTARREIQRLDTILRQFLQAVRPTTPQTERCDLHDIIRDTVKLLEPDFESRQIAVELDLASGFPTLNLDAAQFQQVFYNLLRNAYQAVSTDDGEVTLTTHYNDYECRITIADNGVGIDPEHMGSLFEPYRTTKESGTGLGLLIVRRVVREHGGEIEIESQPDHGTTIHILLPRGPKPVRLLESSDRVIDLEPFESQPS